MQKRFSISLSHLSPMDEVALHHIINCLSKSQYEEERGFGFKSIESTSDYISAILVKRTPVFIPEYNVQLAQIEKRETFVFSEIKFGLDAKLKLLEIFGPTKDVPKVKSSLRPFLPKNIRMSSVELTPSNTVPKLLDYYTSARIVRLTVRNFKYNEGVIGSYDMRIIRPEIALDIISTYAADVITATVSINSDLLNNVAMKLTNTGRLILHCEDDQLIEFFSFTKEALFGGNEKYA